MDDFFIYDEIEESSIINVTSLWNIKKRQDQNLRLLHLPYLSRCLKFEKVVIIFRAHLSQYIQQNRFKSVTNYGAVLVCSLREVCPSVCPLCFASKSGLRISIKFDITVPTLKRCRADFIFIYTSSVFPLFWVKIIQK